MTRSSTLAENVAAALRHSIFQGAYTSGERLVELVVAQDMNVSQNTVRDALRLLEQDGLVVKRARYGTHVRSYSPDEAAEIYDLWAAVEGLALQSALVRLDHSGIATLQDLIDRYGTSLNQGHIQQAQSLRFEFHWRLAQAADRQLTLELLQGLHNQARLLETTNSLPSSEEKPTQQDSYARLIDAIRHRNADPAQMALNACIRLGMPYSAAG